MLMITILVKPRRFIPKQFNPPLKIKKEIFTDSD